MNMHIYIYIFMYSFIHLFSQKNDTAVKYCAALLVTRGAYTHTLICIYIYIYINTANSGKEKQVCSRH